MWLFFFSSPALSANLGVELYTESSPKLELDCVQLSHRWCLTPWLIGEIADPLLQQTCRTKSHYLGEGRKLCLHGGNVHSCCDVTDARLTLNPRGEEWWDGAVGVGLKRSRTALPANLAGFSALKGEQKWDCLWGGKMSWVNLRKQWSLMWYSSSTADCGGIFFHMEWGQQESRY